MNQSMTLDDNTIFKQKVQNMYTLSTGDFLYHNLYNAFLSENQLQLVSDDAKL